MPQRRDHRHIAQYGGHGGGGAAAFAPSDIANLQAWYDFSDASTLFKDTGLTTPVTADADIIKGVVDKANAYDLTEATNGPAYKTNIQNSKSIARFDGTNDILTNAAFFAFQTLDTATIFCVVKPTNADSAYFEAGAAGNNTGINIQNFSGTLYFRVVSGGSKDRTVLHTIGGYHRYTLKYDAANTLLDARVDAAQVGVNPSPGVMDFTTGTFVMGAYGGGAAGFLAGDVAEMLFYSTVLTAGNIDTIEAYLATKWGL